MAPGLPSARILRDVARMAWPEERLGTFQVHSDGWTNLVLEADGRLVFRFPRRASVARSLGFEVRLLEFLCQHLSVPIPDPIRIAVLDEPRGWPFMVYLKLPGIPLNDLAALGQSDQQTLTRFLVRLFRELRELPLAPLVGLGVMPGGNRSWAMTYRKLWRRYLRVGAPHVSHAVHQATAREFRSFFRTLADSHYRPVLLHDDLWPSHILWDSESGKPSGVIDWEDARFGDPAFDLTQIQGLPKQLSERLVAHRQGPGDDAFSERLAFYRRIGSLQSFLYGLESGRKSIAQKALRDLMVSLDIGV